LLEGTEPPDLDPAKLRKLEKKLSLSGPQDLRGG